MKAFKLADKKSENLNAKLVEADQDKKSTETTLDMAKRQAEAQHKQLRQAEDELSVARSQIKVLTKKLEEVEKAKEQAEQDGYEVGVTETEVALEAEVSKVCRFYYLKVWKEAFDQDGVEPSSALRRAENVYYPSAINASVSKEVDEGEESLTKALPTTNISSDSAEHAKDVEKAVDLTKEVAPNAPLPLDAPKEPPKEKEASQNMEIVLATLPIPSKEDLKGKRPASITAASTQPPKTQKDKLVIKMKP